MPNRFSSGKRSIAVCDVCGFQYPLKTLRSVIVKHRDTNVLACRECWDKDHPQLSLGLYPVNDPQAVRNPRPDTSYLQSGYDADGGPGGGSRVIEWGWNPVGLNNPLGLPGLQNSLQAVGRVGTVTVANLVDPAGFPLPPDGAQAAGQVGIVTVVIG